MCCFNDTVEGFEGCEAYTSTIKNISVNTNGSDANECCQHGSCLCSSLDKALNCSSNKNEVTIYIYSEVVSLSTTTHITNVNSFTLVSNGASISCNGGRGIIFGSVKSLVISKITLSNCGSSPGAISVYDSSLIIRESNFKYSLTRALAAHRSSVYIGYDTKFSSNKGGALYVSNSSLTFNGRTEFVSNFATSGGAIFLTNQSVFSLENGTQISLLNNEAAMYGGAIYTDFVTPCDVQRKLFESANNSFVTFTDNIAGSAGRSWYFALNTTCNLTRNISDPNSLLYYPSSFEYTGSKFNNEIGTTLYQLKLLPPAFCISSNTCNDYGISGIMLGQEILIPAQALGYYGNIARPTQVLVNCSTDDYVLAGNSIVLVHNNTLVRGIKILRRKGNSSVATNTTLRLTAIGKETLSINLRIELSSCVPGFELVSVNEYLQCKCYQHNDVNCLDDSTTMIKYGYWVGKVKDQATVAHCPYQYCQFTSCDVTSFSYCKLPRVQDGQCRYDRTGPACGRCKLGYVLPFDSVKCIKIDKCSLGMTFVVVLLNVVYWFVSFVVLGIICHIFVFKIDYAFGIIYFYSVIEYLLEYTDDNWSVFQFITILSSFTKLKPEFLGTLCIASTDWNRIDQLFLHYIHPIAMFSILWVLLCCKLPMRIKLFVQRLGIRYICLTLLLVYTSLSSTSIELLLPLTFSSVKGIYTYSSPDIMYFHGRHAVYGVVASITAIVIVTGLPVFLLLEPCLSRNVNFIKIKPLLDIFQMCYKFNHRYFAAFYLLCRLIILIVFYSVEDSYNRSFVMLLLCIAITFIHALFMPYANASLNIFDLFILIMATFAASFNTVISFTSFHSAYNGVAIGIVSTPLVVICVIILIYFKRSRTYNKKFTEPEFESQSLITESRRYDDFSPSPTDEFEHPLLITNSQEYTEPLLFNENQLINVSSQKYTIFEPVNDIIESDDNSSDDNILNMSWRYIYIATVCFCACVYT